MKLPNVTTQIPRAACWTNITSESQPAPGPWLANGTEFVAELETPTAAGVGEASAAAEVVGGRFVTTGQVKRGAAAREVAA
jgi:hypothetical protein